MKISLTLSLAVLFIFISKISDGESTSMPKFKYKVVIVGAGISGLGAATHLLKNNVSDILILEASNRLGGRVHTAPFGDYLIEYGAQWVHGQGGNLVYQIAEPYGFFELQDYSKVPNLATISGSKINISLIKNVYSGLQEIFEDRKSMFYCNCSKEYYFEKRFSGISKEKNIDNFTAEAMKNFLLKFEGVLDGTDKMSEVASLTAGDYGQTNGSQNVAWKAGYHTFIDILLGKLDGAELPIIEKTKFNKVVQTIDWSGSEVQIWCEDGSHYFADHVISTVSLGVLKNSAETMFIPPLPKKKLSAIQALGFDLVGKVIIQFDKRWWPLNYDYSLLFLWSEEDKQKFKKESKHGGWASEIIAFQYITNQPRVLLGWVLGDTARHMEKLTDKELTDAVMELFHYFLDDKYKISEPINITRSSWYSNRFVRGSYSYHTVESAQKGYTNADLAQPVTLNQTKPVLLFAGEATHNTFYATVHGALETGLREANRILSF